ncbi:MAG: hypothetical protein KGS61_17425 [Verrucomicrobia bacterium]|nr:hypothetical protein [Verrucomicrobiota bacterium]
MKTISVNISEPVYEDFLRHARRTDRTAAELIREAMEIFRNQRIRPRTSLTTLKPLNLGRPLRPMTRRGDLLGEMMK